jgi:uncharacterized membrane protein YoaK (UPF0700 family)
MCKLSFYFEREEIFFYLPFAYLLSLLFLLLLLLLLFIESNFVIDSIPFSLVVFILGYIPLFPMSTHRV